MRGDEGALFLADFEGLKVATENSPEFLAQNWRDRKDLQQLCDRIQQHLRTFEFAEERTHLPYTPHVPAAAARARREYEIHWQETVSTVALRDFLVLLDDLLATSDEDEGDTGATVDRLGLEIDGWKRQGKEDADNIDYAMSYLSEKLADDDHGDFEWLNDVLDSWSKLRRVVGLDLSGAFWRRQALPHFLFPSHVSAHYGVSHATLYRRLVNAGRAFTFGAPLAALAMQRAVLEELLKTHWGASERWLSSAGIPDLQWEARASRLRTLANEALHTDPEKYSPEQLDRAIIEGFLILRLLIENAPENLAEHVRGKE